VSKPFVCLREYNGLGRRLGDFLYKLNLTAGYSQLFCSYLNFLVLSKHFLPTVLMVALLVQSVCRLYGMYCV